MKKKLPNLITTTNFYCGSFDIFYIDDAYLLFDSTSTHVNKSSRSVVRRANPTQHRV